MTSVLSAQEKPPLFVQKRKTLKTPIATVQEKRAKAEDKEFLRSNKSSLKKLVKQPGIYNDIKAYYKSDDEDEEEDEGENKNSNYDIAEMGGDIKDAMKKHNVTIGGNPHSIQGIPIVYTSKSTGFNLGAKFSIINLKHEDPYTYRLSLQYWITDRGGRDHLVELDMPHFFFSKSWHVRLSYEYPKTMTQKYFGVGNSSVYNTALTSPNSPDFLSKTYYQYISLYPKFKFDIEYKIIGQYLSVYGGLALDKATISPYNQNEKSKIYTEQPNGYSGGKTNYVKGGIRYDTTDYPFNPTRGITLSGTYTNHGKFIKSDYPHSNLDLAYVGFFSFWTYFTFAQRVMIDQMWGDLPFFALSEFRSYDDYRGLGGEDFLRGAPSYRYIDNLKFANQFELRTRVYNGGLVGQMVMIHFNPFWDMGRVWDRKQKISLGGFHNSFGCEFRFTWNYRSIMSITMGKSSDGFSSYLTFGESFM